LQEQQRAAACRLQAWWMRKKMRRRVQNLQQADERALEAAKYAVKETAFLVR